jgi:hypothetical protein
MASPAPDLLLMLAFMAGVAGMSLGVLAAVPFVIVANRNGRFVGLESRSPPPPKPRVSGHRAWQPAPMPLG